MYSRKIIRLNPKNYIGQTAIFVTLCCHQRHRNFANALLCNSTLEILRETAITRDFAIHAYCFMPNHLHLLVEGLSHTSDFLNFMKTFKLRSSRAFAKSHGTILWQDKYYDHILRRSDEFESVCLYVWLNPIRADLAQTMGEYPFAGSFTRQIPHGFPDQSPWHPPDRCKIRA